MRKKEGREGKWGGNREEGGLGKREREQKTNDTTRNVLIIVDFEADIPPTGFNGFQLSLLFLSDRGVLFPRCLAFGFGYTGVGSVWGGVFVWLDRSLYNRYCRLDYHVSALHHHTTRRQGKSCSPVWSCPFFRIFLDKMLHWKTLHINV
jgi:hypothetical protein